ncbi:MAG: TonB-dependent receptor [Sphingomonas sp.]|uniref:TonB-dependent receptor n=1 Tax=Sphingomonas sp. TaxID=28214 RepID=UPI0017D67FAC|nr:TonB-dependent receptor [Sphingomonas sp.]MBA3668251.1 TonB-dependent receptor [Sphingomonas sp.]
MRSALLITASLIALIQPAIAQTVPDDDEAEDQQVPRTEIVVTGQRLDAARSKVEPSLGASTYTLSNEAIEHRPGGETRDLGFILAQVPGVRRDGSGALIVRNAPGKIQYRLNNIILPEGVADFGESLSSRLADKTELITGALPAQYGLVSGGVVNVTTKNGLYMKGGQAELYGGSHHSVEPAFEWSASRGGSSLFASGSFRRSDIGLAPLDAAANPAHDRIRELEGFLFADHLIDEEQRTSLILGSSNERNQVPGRAIAGLPGAEHAHGERRVSNHYAIAFYQRSDEALTLQASMFGLVSNEVIRPDEPLSLAADGVSRATRGWRRSVGTQIEAAYEAGARHTLRAGILLSNDREREAERDLAGTPLASAALFDADSVEHRVTASAFVQDEVRLAPRLTLNAGLRFDHVTDVGEPAQLGPRASLVYATPAGFTAHVGYARYVVAPPLGEAAPRSPFSGGAVNDSAREERDDYFDVGLQQKLGEWTFGIDGYWRSARDLLAQREWQFAPIERSFNYRRGRLHGVDLSLTYADGPVTAWSNLALAQANGREIVSNQGEFSAAQLDYAAAHDLPIDQDQRVTASGGLSYRFGHLLLSGDLLYGSGARRTAAGGVPNGARLPAHATFDLAAVYRLSLIEGRPLELRLDVTNLFDRSYGLGDGTGFAGGAPQWAERRGVFVGLEQSF